MKKLIYSLTFLLFLSMTVTTSTSCNRGYGCPANENVGANTDRKGQLSTKKGKSNLFPKKVRKTRG